MEVKTEDSTSDRWHLTPLDGTCSRPLPCAHAIIYSTLKQAPVILFPLHLLLCFSDLLYTKLWNKTHLYLLSLSLLPFSLEFIPMRLPFLPTLQVILSRHRRSILTISWLSPFYNEETEVQRGLGHWVFSSRTQTRVLLSYSLPVSFYPVLAHDKIAFADKGCEEDCHGLEYQFTPSI